MQKLTKPSTPGPSLSESNRSLDQKTMMDQIKTYITQSRTANTDGDVLRASNLAQKARLLCDELLKK